MITNRIIVDGTYFVINFYNFYNYGGIHIYPLIIFMMSMFCNHIIARNHETLQFEMLNDFENSDGKKRKAVNPQSNVSTVQFKLMVFGWYLTILFNFIEHISFRTIYDFYINLIVGFFAILYMHHIINKSWWNLTIGEYFMGYCFFFN